MADLIANLQAVAGAGGGEGEYIEDLFSTYVFEGNGSTQTITNGIDLSGEGGMVFHKARSATYDPRIIDTETGAGKVLYPNYDLDQKTDSNGLTSFNSDGFSLGTSGQWNTSGQYYASWTFRKAPKFFDVVTWTGNGVAGRTVSHNLNSVPGCIIVKSTSNTGYNWAVYHRGVHATSPEDYYLVLNTNTIKSDNSSAWNDTAPTSTEFTVGTGALMNGNGVEYVAYLFAHNDGDGDFGESGDQDIIKCGSFTTDSFNDAFVNLGFEPQWLMVKAVDSTEDWRVVDNMRYIDRASLRYLNLFPNRNYRDTASAGCGENGFTGNGFNWDNATYSNNRYIYVAIRRGPMKTPEDATTVHAQDDAALSTTEPYTAGFPTDWVFEKVNADSGGNFYAFGRVFGKNGYQYLSVNNAITDLSAFSNLNYSGWDSHSKVDGLGYNDGNDIAYMFRRAQGFFDVQRFQGNAASGNTFNHALGVVPEFIMIKSGGAVHWGAYHKDMFSDTASEAYNGGITFEDNPVRNINDNWWDDTAPTDSVVTLGNGNYTNSNNLNVALLFASVPGVCHIGSYTGTGSAQNIDCGFSAGARFVVVKCVSAGQNWFIKIRNQNNGMRFNGTTSPFNGMFPSYSSGFGVSSDDLVSDLGEHFIYIAIA